MFARTFSKSATQLGRADKDGWTAPPPRCGYLCIAPQAQQYKRREGRQSSGNRRLNDPWLGSQCPSIQCSFGSTSRAFPSLTSFRAFLPLHLVWVYSITPSTLPPFVSLTTLKNLLPSLFHNRPLQSIHQTIPSKWLKQVSLVSPYPPSPTSPSASRWVLAAFCQHPLCLRS